MLVVPPSKAPLVSVASVGCATTASFGVWLHKRSPDAARNATGATFAWGPFRPLDFSGPRTPPECEAPPEDHSQLVFAYRLLMGRRYSSRISRVPAQIMSQMGRLAGRLGTDHPGCDHQDLQSESWSTSQRGCQWAEVTCQWPY
jgi:hypothetical protein